MKVKSIMHPVIQHLGMTDSLSTAARLLEEEGATAIPVRDQDGVFLGLVTAQKLVDVSINAPRKAKDTTVTDLVSAQTMTCTINDDVMTLAARAEAEGCSHAAVVDEQGGFLGIVDLTAYQEARPDRQHRDEALDEALDETFPASDPISPL